MEARPDVLNHNTETVPRLYRQVRLGARYERSLAVLEHARRVQPETPTKSGLMLGLERRRGGAASDARSARSSRRHPHLGQYLRPSPKHLPIVRYVTPREFEEFRIAGNEMASRMWSPALWCAAPTRGRAIDCGQFANLRGG